jgi:chaperone modulatory protein CbpM
MIGLEAVFLQVHDLAPVDLDRWIENAWVRPEGRPGAWAFHDIDVARIRLIVELRDHLEVNEAALPTVLSLVDQVYAMRRRLQRLNAALAEEPPELREMLARLLDGAA